VPKSNAKPQAMIRVWDTGVPSLEPLAPAALAAKNGWSPIAMPTTTAAFKGDAVISNDRILAAVRNQGSAVEVYSVGRQGPAAGLRRLLLSPGGELLAQIERVSLVENTRGAACLEVSGKTAQGTALAAKFRIKRGEVFVETEPGAGAGRLRVECPGRFVVLP